MANVKTPLKEIFIMFEPWQLAAKDDVAVEMLLKQFTLAQITEFIRVASENNAANVQALLLEYKNKNFSDFDPMEEFTLD